MFEHGAMAFDTYQIKYRTHVFCLTGKYYIQETKINQPREGYNITLFLMC